MSEKDIKGIFPFVPQKQMASLTPLQVPKKPTGLASSTGSIDIGDVPDTVSCKIDLNNLVKKTKNLLGV